VSRDENCVHGINQSFICLCTEKFVITITKINEPICKAHCAGGGRGYLLLAVAGNGRKSLHQHVAEFSLIFRQ